MKSRLLAALVALLLMTVAAVAGEPTAFQLVKAGNDYVSKDARDQVVQIRSERSSGSLTPSVWYIVYYDPDASLKATEVKFVSGKKQDVKRPFRLLEPISGADKKLDRSKMKADSDKVLKNASGEPIFKKVKLVASQMWLEHCDVGPTWKVRFWASKNSNSSQDVDIGDIYVSAEDGKTVRTDLHIDRVNQ
jgi:hypothetical protein